MKKFRLLALILCLAAMATCLFACGSETSDPKNTIDMSEIGLDLFEDKELTLPESVSGTASWATSDETLVTVKDGVVSATGQKEGAANVSATVGDVTVVYPIKVTDSGERPSLTAEEFSVYKGKTVDIKQHISLTYKDVEITEGVTYTYNPVGAQVTVAEDGTVSGVAVGTTKIQVRATYKGFQTSAKSVSVTIEESDIVKPAKDKVSLSIFEGDVDPTSYAIEATVLVNAEEVKDATITASIESGEDYIELNGLTITSKAIGKAVVLLTYTAGDVTVNGRIEVTVHDDSVEYKAGANLQHNSSDGTFKKVTEGEFENCYEYALTDHGNYWDNAIKESSSLTSILNNGYKTFSYEIYFVDCASLVVYIPSSFQSNSGAFCMYDLSTTGNKYNKTVGKYTGDDDLLHIYGADGQHLADDTELVTGQWYTIVYDLSSYTDGWSMMGLSINTTANKQKAYLRNFAFHTTANLLPDGTYDARHPIGGEFDDDEVSDEKDDFLNNLMLGSKAVSVKKVSSGNFVGSYKIRSQASADIASISFSDIHDSANEPQAFFTQGKHYIKFEIYIASGTGLGICNWVKGVNGGADVKLETIITPSTADHDTVSIYNSFGNLSALNADKWYTVLVNVPYDDNNLPEWDMFYIGLPGSKYAPATGYIRNVEYLTENPNIVGDDSEIATKLSTAADLVKQTEAIDGVEGAYLYTNNTASYYAGRLQFATQTYYGKAVTLKVRYNDTARFFFSINWYDSWNRQAQWKYDKNIHHFDLNGNYVKTPDENVWYYLVVDLTELTKDDWMNYITTGVTGKDGKGVYIADLRILDACPYDIPEEDTSNIAEYLTPTNYSTLEKVGTYEGVENAYKYTNNHNWYEGRINIDKDAFKGKYVSIKVRNEHDGTFNLCQNKKPVTSCSYARVYNLSGEKVTTMVKGTWYEIVLDYTETDPEEDYWCSYYQVEPPITIVTYLADLKLSDEDPYVETNIDKYLSAPESATLEKVGTYEGVENAYRYTNNDNWWTGRLAVATTDFVGKYISIKIRNEHDGVFTIGSADTYAYSIENLSFVKVYDLDGNEVTDKKMVKNVWYELVLDYTSGTPAGNWASYLQGKTCIETYIAKLQILTEDPHKETNIDKYLSAPESATLEKVGTYKGVENAYKYTNNGNWWTGRLAVDTTDFTGKYVSIKICNGHDGAFTIGSANNTPFQVTSLLSVKIYDLDGNEVTTMAKDVWYELVIDCTSGIADSWASQIEPPKEIVTYLADLQILDANPHTANA